MTRKQVIKRLVQLKLQAITLIQEAAEEQTRKLLADITALQQELRELDNAENTAT